MKKFFAIALLITSAFVSGVVYAGPPEPSNDGMKKRIVGARQSEPTRVYKLVRYGRLPTGINSPSIASNDVVVYDTVSDDGISVAFTTTSQDATVAGIAVTAIQTSDITTGRIASEYEGGRSWGWIIVHGPAFAKVSAGGTNGHAAGAIWVTSRDSGAVTTHEALVASNANSLTVGVNAAAGRGGFFFDAATAANTQEEVFVNLE